MPTTKKNKRHLKINLKKKTRSKTKQTKQMVGPAPTDHILFYDDDLQYNILPFRKSWPRVKALYVPEGKNYTPILKDATHFHYPRLFLEMYPQNKYAAALVAGLTTSQPKNLCDMCKVTTGQALTLHDMDQLIKWANHAVVPLTKRTVLFDWDKTLSVCNGIFIPEMDMNHVLKYQLTMPFTFTDMAQYFAGTIERYHALRQMFAELRRNQVRCIIFTNNGWAAIDSPSTNRRRFERINFFCQIVQALDPLMTVTDIIYGNLDKETEFGKNKVLKQIYSEIQPKRKR